MKGLAAVLGMLCAGCSYLGTARDCDPSDLESEPGWVLVRGVPFISQAERKDCGAAALAMVMAHAGVETSIEEIRRECRTDSDEGIKAGRLRDFARGKGLAAYLFHGELEDFEKELSRGRPLIVGVAKPFASGPLLHYEVVVGVHPEKQEIVTLDPARGWRRNTFEGFRLEWTPVQQPMLVVFRRAE